MTAITSASNAFYAVANPIESTINAFSNTSYDIYSEMLDTVCNNTLNYTTVLSNNIYTEFENRVNIISNYAYDTLPDRIDHLSNNATNDITSELDWVSNNAHTTDDLNEIMSNDYHLSNISEANYISLSNQTMVTLNDYLDLVSNEAYSNVNDLNAFSNTLYGDIDTVSSKGITISNFVYIGLQSNIDILDSNIGELSNAGHIDYTSLSNANYLNSETVLSNESYIALPDHLTNVSNLIVDGVSNFEIHPVFSVLCNPVDTNRTFTWYSCNYNSLDASYANVQYLGYNYSGSGTLNVSRTNPHFSGVENTAGSYTFKLRAATPFGVSAEETVSFTINPWDISSETAFGELTELRAGERISSVWYLDFSVYEGCVVLSNSVYYLDRSSSYNDYSSNYAFFYSPTAQRIHSIRLDENGSNDDVVYYTGVSNIADGTNMGSAGTVMTSWTSDNKSGSYDTSIRGYSMPIGGYYTNVFYNTTYFQITPTNSDLDNMCSRNSDWSYGFRLADTWMGGGQANQMLAPTGSNYFINGVSGYEIGAGSYYEDIHYGNSTWGPYQTTSIGTSWNVSSSNFVIGDVGDLITITYNGTTGRYQIYVNNDVIVDTSSSFYLYMPYTTTNPVLRFGDIGDVNGITGYPEDYDEISSWPYRLSSLFLANGTEFDATAVADLVTNKADLTGATNYSSITTLIEFGSSSTTTVKGNVDLTIGTISFD